MYELNGKTAIVCGSSQGIGRASAMLLREQGASVVLVARDQTALDAVLAELPREAKQQHATLVADFREPELLQERVAAYVGQHGTAHILINNTGGPASGPVLDAKPQD